MAWRRGRVAECTSLLMTQSRNTLTGSNPVVSATDWSKIDFLKIIEDYNSMIKNISPDCYLGGFASKAVRNLFMSNGVAKCDMIKAAEIMNEFGNFGDLKSWIKNYEDLRLTPDEIEYLNSVTYNG